VSKIIAAVALFVFAVFGPTKSSEFCLTKAKFVPNERFYEMAVERIISHDKTFPYTNYNGLLLSMEDCCDVLVEGFRRSFSERYGTMNVYDVKLWTFLKIVHVRYPRLIGSTQGTQHIFVAYDKCVTFVEDASTFMPAVKSSLN
jgi:hypothetical protein